METKLQFKWHHLIAFREMILAAERYYYNCAKQTSTVFLDQITDIEKHQLFIQFRQRLDKKVLAKENKLVDKVTFTLSPSETCLLLSSIIPTLNDQYKDMVKTNIIKECYESYINNNFSYPIARNKTKKQLAPAAITDVDFEM